MQKILSGVLALVVLCFPVSAQLKKIEASSGCGQQTAKQCLDLAMQAMGGKERLQKLKSVRLQTIGHTLLMEQSYRQDPFITSYEQTQTTLDLANGRLFSEAKLTWPESDRNQWESDSTLVIGPEGGVNRAKDGDTPCSLAKLDEARETLALGPARVLLTADAATDLHFEKSEILRSTPHAVLVFTWQKVPVRILLNPFNHLPDAIETTQEFHDFWFFWGDVRQRIYFDNWKLFRNIAYPTNLVEERNGSIWRSTQVLDVEFDVPTEENQFHMDTAVAKRSAASRGWNRPFKADKSVALAPGIDLFPGAWNSTIVKQSNGIVILEAPISGLYMQGVVEEARKRYPELPIKAVLSTSDSWPHTGGIRFAVSEHFPIYILDLNRPLLDKIIAAPHAIDPDALQEATRPKDLHWKKDPFWRIVSGKEEIGSGPNRMELYPLRGASTERQYMVYFPEHHLLYASDTLVLTDDNTLYDPELMSEVVQAVKRENLQVDTVFAMHQGPVSWNQVLTLIEKSQQS